MHGTIGKTNFLFNNSSSIDKNFEKKGSPAMKGFENSMNSSVFLSMTNPSARKTNGSIFG